MQTWTLEGLGWTGIELLFTVLQCVASVQLLNGVQQGDAQAIEAFNFFLGRVEDQEGLKRGGFC